MLSEKISNRQKKCSRSARVALTPWQWRQTLGTVCRPCCSLHFSGASISGSRTSPPACTGPVGTVRRNTPMHTPPACSVGMLRRHAPSACPVLPTPPERAGAGSPRARRPTGASCRAAAAPPLRPQGRAARRSRRRPAGRSLQCRAARMACGAGRARKACAERAAVTVARAGGAAQCSPWRIEPTASAHAEAEASAGGIIASAPAGRARGAARSPACCRSSASTAETCASLH